MAELYKKTRYQESWQAVGWWLIPKTVAIVMDSGPHGQWHRWNSSWEFIWFAPMAHDWAIFRRVVGYGAV